MTSLLTKLININACQAFHEKKSSENYENAVDADIKIIDYEG
ncbi:hypothetical protein SAMN04487898_11522 [Pedobacter sp. ok626]|nr:hypothetical protein SAMN04487898_11522 [Pedobacter sp. ok626]